MRPEVVESAGDEDDALLLDLGRNLAVSRDLVVEGGEDQRGVRGLQAHTGENRYRGAGRHRTGGPGHGLGEDVAVNPELHSALLSAFMQSQPATRSGPQKRQDDPYGV